MTSLVAQPLREIVEAIEAAHLTADERRRLAEDA